MNQREFLDILHTAETLKDEIRHCTTSKDRPESVAEHSWRISFMAFLLKEEFPEADIGKVINMCIIHDLGECFTGDIPVHLKTDRDSEQEERALNEWLDTLPEDVSGRMRDLYYEMNRQVSMEAKLYKAIDKLEAVIQHNEEPLKNWNEDEYRLQQNYAFDVVEFSDWLTELRKIILEDTMFKIENGK